MGLIDIVNNYLNPAESERFAEWAFGSEYKSLRTPTEFLTAWNERHRDDFHCRPYGNLHNDLKEIIYLWEKNK